MKDNPMKGSVQCLYSRNGDRFVNEFPKRKSVSVPQIGEPFAGFTTPAKHVIATRDGGFVVTTRNSVYQFTPDPKPLGPPGESTIRKVVRAARRYEDMREIQNMTPSNLLDAVDEACVWYEIQRPAVRRRRDD